MESGPVGDSALRGWAEARGSSPAVAGAQDILEVASDHRLSAWPLVAAKLGLRPGEVSGLVWDDIDWDLETITVRRTLKRSGELKQGTNTGVVRTLKMPADVVTALRLHRKQLAEDRLLMGERWSRKSKDLVFVSEAGTPLQGSNMRRLVSRWAEQAGVEGAVTRYDFRHTALTRLWEMGASRDELADIADHKDTRIVDKHYVHRDQLTVSAAADLWDREGGAG